MTEATKELLTFSERLKYALDTLKVTQAELAREVGASPQLINYLCKSSTKSSGYAYEIATVLGINLDWLLYGQGAMRYEDDPIVKLVREQQRVPIIHWPNINDALHSKHIPDPMDHTSWLLTTTAVSAKAFALLVNDNSMFPILQRNSTIIIVDPLIQPRHSDYVLAHITSMDEYLLRTLTINNDIKILSPFYEKGYTKITLQPEDVIIGVIAEYRWHIERSL